jgi:hypothetical protein
MDPQKTQRIFPDLCDEASLPARCSLHIRRIDRIESRMDRYDEDLRIIREMRDLIAEINQRLTKLEVRVGIIVWPLGVIAASALSGVVIAFFRLILK